MKIHILTFLCLTLALSTLGCGKDREESTDDVTAEQGEDLAAVEVAQEGTEFDPAIEPEKLPADVWYCDMGTVHWAGGDKPESGTCPRCGMDVKQHDPAAQKEEHDHPHGGDHDHSH